MKLLKLGILISPVKIFVSVLLLCLLVSFYFIDAFKVSSIEKAQSDALALAQHHAALVNTTIEKNMSANYALAAMVRQSQGEAGFFNTYAKNLHQIYPIVSHFTLSPNGIIQHVYPLAGNQASIGLNQLEFIPQQEEANKAKSSRLLTLAGPVKLVQGGVAIIGRWPVMLKNKAGEERFWGFTNVAVTLDALLKKANFSALEKQGYDYRLVKSLGADETLIFASVDAELKQAIVIDIQLPNDVWQLQLAPTAGWVKWADLQLEIVSYLIISGLIAGLVALICHIYLIKNGLEGVVKQRTLALTNTNKRLTGLLDAIPDFLFEIDDNEEVLQCHFPSKLLSRRFGTHIVGSYLGDVFPESVILVYQDSFKEAKNEGHSAGKSFCLDIEGKEHWFELSVSYSISSDSNRPCFVALARDISRRKKAESELRIAATAFETQDGILITDIQHKIVRVNTAFQKITGYQEAEILDQNISLLRSGRHDETFFQKIFACIDDCGYWEGEIWNRKKCGEIVPELTTISTVYNDLKIPINYVYIIKDISLTKQNEQLINQLSYYDSLTCLPNRKMISEKVEQLIKKAQLQSETFNASGHYSPLIRHALLFIDLDHFKNINDSKGYSAGDKLLQEVAHRLIDTVRSTDIVARFGGDEFILLLEGVDVSLDAGRALYRAKKVSCLINDALAQVFEINGEHFYISSSVGITEIDESVDEVFDAFKHAELAMYEAKSRGRNRYCFYSPQMQAKILERVNLETAMRKALIKDEFLLYYQPQFDDLGVLRGVEALIRWLHPDKGIISPMQFIPLAEDSKLIIPIGEWVVREACNTLARWRDDPLLNQVKVSVNVSVIQFAQEDFVDLVRFILVETGVDAKLLQFELTESMLIDDKANILAKMQGLKALGVLLSLDDFGTGYSSLSYLQQLPFDQLKIDQSFVRNLNGQGDQHPLALTITTMGHSLGLEVIAEGIEEKESMLKLQSFGCNLFQGYFMGHPMPLSKLEEVVLQQLSLMQADS